MAADRQPKMRAMIMARTEPERRAALAELLPLQQRGLRGPVRGDARAADHDPPARPAAARVPARPRRARPARAEGPRRARARAARRSSRSSSWSCASARSTRCSARAAAGSGSCTPRSTRCRSRRSCSPRARRPTPPQLEIMIPLVDFEAELAELRALVVARRRAPRAARGRGLHRRHDDRAAARVLRRRPARGATRTSSPSAPTTSRRPRSASRATTSRPASCPRTSSAGSSTARRSSRSTSTASARWSRSPSARGRARREGIELGVCGEHGGDPDSIAFFHRAGLDYVSCSPYRLPIARVAAAQAALASDDARHSSRVGIAARWRASTACSRPARRTALHRAERLGGASSSPAAGSGTSTRPRAAAAWPRCSARCSPTRAGRGVDARWAGDRRRRAVLRGHQAPPQPAARHAGRRRSARGRRARALRGGAGAQRRRAARLLEPGDIVDAARPADRRADPARARAAACRSSGAATSGSTCRTSWRARPGGSSSPTCCRPTPTCSRARRSSGTSSTRRGARSSRRRSTLRAQERGARRRRRSSDPRRRGLRAAVRDAPRLPPLGRRTGEVARRAHDARDAPARRRASATCCRSRAGIRSRTRSA